MAPCFYTPPLARRYNPQSEDALDRHVIGPTSCKRVAPMAHIHKSQPRASNAATLTLLHEAPTHTRVVISLPMLTRVREASLLLSPASRRALLGMQASVPIQQVALLQHDIKRSHLLACPDSLGIGQA